MKRLLHSKPQPYPGDPAPEGIQNRALSVRQPYAEAILRGLKKIEYRSQPTKIRGRVYLYASQKLGEFENYPELEPDLESLPRGVLVGTVEIVGCTDVPGNYEWRLGDPQRLPELVKPEKRAQPVWFRPFAEETKSSDL